MKVAYLTRIHKESDLIYSNLLYHYNLGIRNFYITFNQSDDKTKQEAFRFFKDFDCMYHIYLDNDLEYTQPEQFNKMSKDAYDAGLKWQIPIDADELFYIKDMPLNDFILQYDNHKYGFLVFKWIDYHGSEDELAFKWKTRQVTPRRESKIIVKWHPECKWGDGHHLLTAKRNKIAEISTNQGFYAHYPNRSKDQLEYKLKRIGKAFIDRFGKNSKRPQVKNYIKMQQNERYIDQIWQKVLDERSIVELTEEQIF